MVTKVEEATPANVDEVDSSHDIGDMLDETTDSFGDVQEDIGVVQDTGKGMEAEEAAEEGTQDLEPPSVEEKIAEPDPVAEPVVDELAHLREQLSNLSAVLIQHGINPAQLGQPPATSPAATQDPTTAPSTPPSPIESKAAQVELAPLSISKDEFDAIFESPESLIGLLNKVRESAVEQVLRSVPTLTASIVNQQTVLNRMVQDFYSQNDDLAGVKPFVAVVANEIAARNPDWSVEQVFAEAATESRKRLNLKKEVAKATPTNPAVRPGLPGNTNSRRAPSAPQLSKLEKELEDLM